jgi:hypothetical protein
MILKQEWNRVTKSAGLTKIVAAPRYVSKLAQQGQLLICENELMGVDLKFMVAYRTCTLTSKIEVVVHCQTERCQRVCHSVCFDEK